MGAIGILSTNSRTEWVVMTDWRAMIETARAETGDVAIVQRVDEEEEELVVSLTATMCNALQQHSCNSATRWMGMKIVLDSECRWRVCTRPSREETRPMPIHKHHLT
jgi:hypothetical protein